MEAVTLNALAGGDNCSRGMIVGALFGATSVGGEIPLEWVKKVDSLLWNEICDRADKVRILNKGSLLLCVFIFG